MKNTETETNQILRGAIIGGGPGSLIGSTHRIAINFDPAAKIVAGVFSRDRNKNKDMANTLGISPERCYDSLEELIAGEAAQPIEERIEWISVLTPNAYHFEQISALIAAGYHVISEKPLTATLDEARELNNLISKSKCFFGLTHTYSGYPMVKEARHRIAAGEIGKIHKVVVQYAQGWLMNVNIKEDGARPWRTLRSVSGNSCTVADIGTHAAHLLRYVTGLEIQRLLAVTNTAIPWNEMEDDANVLLDLENGAKGVLIISQSSTGERNHITFQIYGEEGSLEWTHDRPQVLLRRDKNGLMHEFESGSDELLTTTQGINRLPAGHPEGLIEAFANLYEEAFRAIRTIKSGNTPESPDIPGIEDGLFGMKFIDYVLASAADDAAWISWDDNIGENNE